jgi:hypothetical protein
MAGLIGAIIIILFLYDSPASKRLVPCHTQRVGRIGEKRSIGSLERSVHLDIGIIQCGMYISPTQ